MRLLPSSKTQFDISEFSPANKEGYMILCIETSTDVCSVALVDEGIILSDVMLCEGRRHSSELAVIIEQSLKEARVERRSLQAIAISDGPGSYTGLRVGASTAKGLCFGLDIPLIAIPSLQMMAAICTDQDVPIMATIDARRMEAYTAVYLNGREISPITSTIWTSEVFHDLSDRYPGLIICGNGIAKAKNEFMIPDHITILPSEADAKLMCDIATYKFAAKEYEDLAYHSPTYYKSPNITTPKRFLQN